MDGIFTRNAYSKFETDAPCHAPPELIESELSKCGNTLQGEGEANGISKQSERFEAYGWEKAS